MNANELAEIQAFKTEELTMWERNTTATMLRQQQAEIEALKAGKIKAYDNGYEDGRKPNTHPVSQYKAITNTKIEPTVVSYTHPVKELTETSYETVFDGEKYTTKLVEPAKELTDEVKDALMDALSGWRYIRECHGDLYGVGWDRVQEKLEAILRKAQEK